MEKKEKKMFEEEEKRQQRHRLKKTNIDLNSPGKQVGSLALHTCRLAHMLAHHTKKYLTKRTF